MIQIFFNVVASIFLIWISVKWSSARVLDGSIKFIFLMVGLLGILLTITNYQNYNL